MISCPKQAHKLYSSALCFCHYLVCLRDKNHTMVSGNTMVTCIGTQITPARPCGYIWICSSLPRKLGYNWNRIIPDLLRWISMTLTWLWKLLSGHNLPTNIFCSMSANTSFKESVSLCGQSSGVMQIKTSTTYIFLPINFNSMFLNEQTRQKVCMCPVFLHRNCPGTTYCQGKCHTAINSFCMTYMSSVLNAHII